MKKVLVVQHDPRDVAGRLGTVLSARGVALKVLSPHAGDALPATLDGLSGLVVLGGPMSVHRHAEWPFLAEEMRLLRQAVAAELPVLGICLGAQLLAAALGAAVRRNDSPEIGWHPLTLLPGAASDPLFAGLPETCTVFQWHSDTFALPSGAVHLASSALCAQQGFRYGAAAWGLQFHLETDGPKLAALTAAFARSLQAAGVDGARLLQEAENFLPEASEIADVVFGRWADRLR